MIDLGGKVGSDILRERTHSRNNYQLLLKMRKYCRRPAELAQDLTISRTVDCTICLTEDVKRSIGWPR